MNLESFIVPKRLVAGLVLLVLLAVGSDGYAKTINYKSSGAGTFISAFFTYDNGANATTILTASEKDNLGGAGTFQCTGEFAPTKTAWSPPLYYISAVHFLNQYHQAAKFAA
jgi:hypothetical protein